MTTYSPPGQGQSKKAKQRAKKRQTTTTTITTSQPKKGKNRQKRNRRGRNDYLENLLDPDSCLGCKIPDPFTCVPTGTFRLTADLTVSTGLFGGCCVIVNPAAMAYSVGNRASDGTYGYTDTNFPGRAMSRTIYQRIRPVSGYVTAVFTGSTMNDGGTAVGFWIPRAAAAPQNYNGAVSIARSRILPLREGLQVLYAPEDNDDVVFVDSTVVSPVFPRMGVAFEGAAANQSITIRVLVNYEGIASADTTDYVTTEVPRGSLEKMTEVRNVLASMTNTVKPLWEGWGKEAAMAAGRTAFNYIGYSVARNFAQRRENTIPRLQYV